MATWDELVQELILLAATAEGDDTDELPEAPPIPEDDDETVAIFFGGLTTADKHLKGTQHDQDQSTHGHGARYGQAVEQLEFFQGKVRPPNFTIVTKRTTGKTTWLAHPKKMKREAIAYSAGDARVQRITGDFAEAIVCEVLRSQGWSVAVMKSKGKGGGLGAPAADIVAVKGTGKRRQVMIVEATGGSIMNGYGAKREDSGRQFNVQVNQGKDKDRVEQLKAKGYTKKQIKKALAGSWAKDREDAHERMTKLSIEATRALRKAGVIGPNDTVPVRMMGVLIDQDRRSVSLYRFAEVPDSGRVGWDQEPIKGKGDGKGSAYYGSWSYKVKDWRDAKGDTLPYLDRW